MAYRNIFVANRAKVSTRHNQLVIESEEKDTVPMEDINTVLLENHQVTVTNAALAKLADYGVLVFICNSKHQPSAVFTPINNHSRQLKVLKLQLAQSKPYVKRLWQQIVVQKIVNQAKCLELCGKQEEAQELLGLSRNVQSGDKGNVEATAALLYFLELFGKGFVRREEDLLINKALNYGYAILRGVIAKNLAVYGFEPCLGIHHHSELNNFNLADDLIEPFRPVVDLYVAQQISVKEIGELTKEQKLELYNLLNVSIYSNGELHSVHYGIERMIKSLSNCFTNHGGELMLPELIALRQHEYE